MIFAFVLLAANAAAISPQLNHYAIRGQLMSPGGGSSPIISLLLVTENGETVKRVSPDIGGGFAFQNVSRGAYYILAKLPGFVEVRQQVEVFGDVIGLTIHLRPERSRDRYVVDDRLGD